MMVSRWSYVATGNVETAPVLDVEREPGGFTVRLQSPHTCTAIELRLSPDVARQLATFINMELAGNYAP